MNDNIWSNLMRRWEGDKKRLNNDKNNNSSNSKVKTFAWSKLTSSPMNFSFSLQIEVDKTVTFERLIPILFELVHTEESWSYFRICIAIIFQTDTNWEPNLISREFLELGNIFKSSIQCSLCTIPSHRNSELFSVLKDVLQNPTTLLVSPKVEANKRESND